VISPPALDLPPPINRPASPGRHQFIDPLPLRRGCPVVFPPVVPLSDRLAVVGKHSAASRPARAAAGQRIGQGKASETATTGAKSLSHQKPSFIELLGITLRIPRFLLDGWSFTDWSCWPGRL